MPSIKKEFIERITDRQRRDGRDLIDVVSSFTGTPKKEGASYKTICPLCGCEHSLVITPGKNIFTCFNCRELSGKDPLAYLMKGQRMDFVEAIEWLASYYHEVVEYNEEKPRNTPKKKADKVAPEQNFCKRMLTESGLTREDVTASIYTNDDQNTFIQRPTFIPGTLDRDGLIDETGDDAVILYYDLEGKPVTYVQEQGKKRVEKPYYRVRYQFPERNLDKNKRAVKYRSPMGAPTFIYYPEKIRSAYRSGAVIETLYIQEGEKKAEKACKHGINSVAVSGIQNIGYKGTLPEDLIKLIERCQTKDVIFMLDADCYDLTKNITVDDPVERRPKNFFYAVRNYKDYFQKLKNHGIYVQLYFGHIRKDKTEDKGTDDILSNTLKNREDELLQDLIYARNEKNGTGQWVQIHKITELPDSRIKEFWSLQSPQDFCKRYIDQLQHLPEFTFGKRRWRFNDAGELESAQPLQDDEIFWIVSKRKNEDEYRFCYVGAKNFLERRGFWRYKKQDGEYEFVHAENNIVEVVKHHEVADYVKSFAQDALQKPVLEMLLRGNAQYIGPNSLTMLDYIQDKFEVPRRGVQHLYFANEIWEITASGIRRQKYSQLQFNIWAHQKKEHSVEQLSSLIEINKSGDKWTYKITPTGRQCDFLLFLENTSNFTWRKKPEDITQEERDANAQHLISKLAAFGYMVASAKEASFSKAVIAMDGKQAEIGRSDGRTGKSLLGKAVGQVTKVKYYNGKDFAAGNRQFVWHGVDSRTKLVLIDDCQRDFNFEDLFGLISGDWPVNPKNAAPYIIPYSESPKVYITTNHAVTGDGASYTDRQWMLAFSDFYNAEHKPEHDFKSYFFDGWDDQQWDLFWNLVAQSLQIYFKYGYIGEPGDRLEKRKLLQEIGEEFQAWADEYYAPGDQTRLGQELQRKEIYNNLLEYVGPKRANYYSAKVFKTKLKKYCELTGLLFNPERYNPVTKSYLEVDKDGRPKIDNKRNGVEYITIADESYYAGRITQPMLYDEAIDLNEDSDLPL